MLESVILLSEGLTVYGWIRPRLALRILINDWMGHRLALRL